MIRSLCLACLVTLTACTSVNPITAFRLSQMSPLTADPAAFAVALDLPDGLKVAPGSAGLLLTATRADSGQTETARADLIATGDVWRVDPADLDAFRAAQRRIANWKDIAPDATSGSFSVRVGGCRSGPGPAPDAVVSVALQTEPGGPFLPLIRNAPVTEILAAGLAPDGPCNTPR